MTLAFRRHTSRAFVAGGLLILLCTPLGIMLGQIRSEAGLVSQLRGQHETLADVAALRQITLEAESGQRGYLLTGNDSYLRPFAQAEHGYRSVERKLVAEIDDRRRAIALGSAVDAKFAELRSTLRARRQSGSAAALAIVETDTSRRLTADILDGLDAVEATQDRSIQRWRSKLNRARHLLTIVTTASIAVAIACLAIGLVKLGRTGRRLAESEARFRLLAGHTSDMIVRLDQDLVHLFVSPACRAICGFDPAELVGLSLAQNIHPDDRACVERQTRRVLSERTDTELMVFRKRHRDGSYFWVEAAVSFVPGEDGAPDTLVAAFRDVSSRKLQADELRVANLELERLARHLGLARDRSERANSAKTRFLAGMSHELRTPLNGMIGYAHLLRLEGDLNEAQGARVAGMLEAGEHLLGMINHVLELSEIEAEHIDLQGETVQVEQVVRSCFGLVRPSADVKRLALDVQADPDAARIVFADPARLRQILLNLLGNAIKFTAAGLITLRLRPGTQPGLLRIEVADTGPGIPADQVDRLFGEFERLGGADEAVEGAGLGLTISARLARLMGGSLTHADNPGGGSIFALEIPTGDVGTTTPIPAAPAASPDRTLRVLVADDVAMNRDIAVAFLHAAGHDAVGVDGGLPAVEQASAGGFDVVLMDVRMPDIDGLEATRRIRSLPGPAGAVPIVAVTAQAFAEQIEECRAAGMNAHLSKPFAPASLLAAVEAAAGSPCLAPGEPCTSGPPLFDEAAFHSTARYLEPPVISSYLDMIEERAAALLGGLISPVAGSVAGDTALPAAAHEFAGSAGLFGFTRASDLARRFERALQTASPDAQRLSAALVETMQHMLPVLREKRGEFAREDA